jgi:hypothetical protein
MNAYCNRRMLSRGPLGLLLSILLWCAATASASSEKIPVLKTMTDTYTNVTVISKSATDVGIAHASGMCNLKVSQLPPQSLRLLGYSVEAGAEDGSSNSSGDSATATDGQRPAKHSFSSGSLSNFVASVSSLSGKLTGPMSAKLTELNVSRTVALSVLGGGLLFYLFFCYSLGLICKKANHAPGFLIWLPGLQMFPLIRAAGMSGWWFVAWLVPGVNVLVQIFWSLNISLARGKSVWVGVLLLLPGLNLFALFYLAFSKAYHGKEASTAPASTSMVLETA